MHPRIRRQFVEGIGLTGVTPEVFHTYWKLMIPFWGNILLGVYLAYSGQYSAAYDYHTNQPPSAQSSRSYENVDPAPQQEQANDNRSSAPAEPAPSTQSSPISLAMDYYLTDTEFNAHIDGTGVNQSLSNLQSTIAEKGIDLQDLFYSSFCPQDVVAKVTLPDGSNQEMTVKFLDTCSPSGNERYGIYNEAGQPILQTLSGANLVMSPDNTAFIGETIACDQSNFVGFQSMSVKTLVEILQDENYPSEKFGNRDELFSFIENVGLDINIFDKIEPIKGSNIDKNGQILMCVK